ncbi:MAG: tetratricopeptide repeat protein [Methylococcaceae bacterium]
MTQPSQAYLFQQAITYHQSGQYVAAERMYLAVLNVQANHPDANHNLGALLNIGRQPAALAHFKTALEAKPERGQYWVSYIDSLIQANQIANAQQVLEQAKQFGLSGDGVLTLEQRLKSINAPKDVGTALAFREIGRYDNAAQSLKNWLKRNPQDAEAFAYLSQILLLNKKVEAAWKAIESALQLNPASDVVRRNWARMLLRKQKTTEARNAAETAWKTNPNNPENQVVLAATLAVNKKTSEALVLLDSVLSSNPRYAEAYATRAQLKILTDVEGALCDAEAALSIKPHLTQLWTMVGHIRFQKGNLPGAIMAMEQACVQDPDNPNLMSALAEYRVASCDYDDGIFLREKISKLTPNDPGIWANLGIVLQKTERNSEASSAYLRSLALKPDQAQIANNLGALALDDEDWEKSLTYFRQAISINPNYAEAHTNMGSALKKQGNLVAAADSIRKALVLQPDMAAAHYNLGNTLADMGEIEQAIVTYEQAVQLNSNLPMVWRNYGDVLRYTDRIVDELNAYRKAYELDPEDIGLDAAVWLAIRYYENDEVKSFQDMLQVSQLILKTTGKKKESIRIYWRYLASLLSYHQKKPQLLHLPKGYAPLFVIGESHSLSPHGMLVHYRGKEMRCTAKWIMGCKQWHLGNPVANKWKRKFEVVMRELPHQSTLLLIIGEIDCRPDEGIIKAWKNLPDKSLDDVAQATVRGYIEYVQKIAAQHIHQVIISGVPATYRDMGDLDAEAAEQLIHVIRMVNAYLKEYSSAAGFDYLDIYALTDDGNGIANGKWHIDRTHLFPHAVVEAFDARKL